MKRARLTPRAIAATAIGSILMVFVLQLVLTWTDDVPVRLTLLTLVWLPLLVLGFWVLGALFQKFLENRVRVRSSYWRLFVRYFGFFLPLLIVVNITTEILGKGELESSLAVILVSHLISASLVSLLLAAADPEGERKKMEAADEEKERKNGETVTTNFID